MVAFTSDFESISVTCLELGQTSCTYTVHENTYLMLFLRISDELTTPFALGWRFCRSYLGQTLEDWRGIKQMSSLLQRR